MPGRKRRSAGGSGGEGVGSGALLSNIRSKYLFFLQR